MDLGLRGKVALVAASSKGLGRAIAEELANEGASVAMCARNEADLIRARDEIARVTAADIIAIAGDVSKPDDVARITSATLERFGRVDILVTNAGGPPSGRFETLTPSMWQQAVDLTLMFWSRKSSLPRHRGRPSSGKKSSWRRRSSSR